LTPLSASVSKKLIINDENSFLADSLTFPRKESGSNLLDEDQGNRKEGGRSKAV